MFSKERMKKQLKNWRWWLTIPLILTVLLSTAVLAAIAVALYLVVLLVETIMVLSAAGVGVVADWRNEGVGLPPTADRRFRGAFMRYNIK